MAAIRALLEHGAAGIAIFDLLPSIRSAERSVESLRADFPAARILALEIDITDAEKVVAAVDEAVKKLGSVDMLLSFAGIVGAGHTLSMEPAHWRKMLDVNLTGSYLCAHAVAKCACY